MEARNTMKIYNLLNHDTSENGKKQSSTVRGSASSRQRAESEEYAPKKSTPKKTKAKLVKDAPKYVEGEPRLPVIFPPHAPDRESTAKRQEKFDLNPSPEDLSRFPCYIPYKCDKRPLLQKTGLEGLNLFQYTFNHNHPKGRLVVAWDYHHGLVKITSFFKALNLLKTAPRKAIDENKGLDEVCFNITGGDIVAQGYWMPYEAARAIAATFCYEIRYALTPVFGNDFAKECLRPEDERFQNFAIDPAIVDSAIETTLAIKSARSQGAKLIANRGDETSSSSEDEPQRRPVRAKPPQRRQAAKYSPEVAQDDSYPSDGNQSSEIDDTPRSVWTPLNGRTSRKIPRTSTAANSPHLSSARSVTSENARPTTVNTSVDTYDADTPITQTKYWRDLTAKRKLEVYEFDYENEGTSEAMRDESSDESMTISIGRPPFKRHIFALEEPIPELTRGFQDLAEGSHRSSRNAEDDYEGPRGHKVRWPALETAMRLQNPDLDARKESAKFVKLVVDGQDQQDVMDAAMGLLGLSRVGDHRAEEEVQGHGETEYESE